MCECGMQTHSHAFDVIFTAKRSPARPLKKALPEEAP